VVIVFHRQHLPANRAEPVLSSQHVADITAHSTHLELDLAVSEVLVPFGIERIRFSFGVDVS